MMDSQISLDDLNKIEAGICEKYVKVARSPEGQFKYPTGKKGLKALHYDKSLFVNAYLRWRMKQGYWTTQYRMSFGNLHASIK